ncbi:aldehyde dehydrogenase (NADP(+)) [Portibacter lacus]|uniref:Ketoglutarate semialdehyde dehydrogenase n=1 Tax=Portibacter lacus TaxID=1099794 RepID=A0AA37STD9_9BACT|nr:aldehyde dehydrogenase (NADP(+)) [Portibacter lacus]GLR17780.1 ketoglutarate semialdehyde dehydrogenase [Portibacter lacus]
MIGYNIIGKKISALNDKTIQASNPKNQEQLEGEFHVATTEEADEAIQKAKAVAREYANLPSSKKALFLRTIADNIEKLSSKLIDRVVAESGLPEGRVTGERGRTCGQLRFFADKIEEGSWVNAIVDRGDVDIRQCLQPLGPVVVFTASNFPLAFSTAGGDTASALASGCPVIVKAHESHLGTNNLVAECIMAAAIECGLPDGVFSSLNGAGYELGSYLVKHPDVQAVAFTGSYGGGKALYDLAQSRPHPIPVFSEMGSVNPIFVLPQAMEKKTTSWAEAIASSVNLGAGQFCTNPGIIVVERNEFLTAFSDQLVDAFSRLQAATMLNKGIHANYNKAKYSKSQESGVKIKYIEIDDDKASLSAHPCLLEVSYADYSKNPKLSQEVFGPFTIMVVCENQSEMKEVASQMEGQLTASIIGEADEIIKANDLLEIAASKVGRIIINGMPTGVAVCEAMNHGGPFPATTDPRFTSVGGNAIYRFVRPVCYQGFPDELLPDALKEANPLGIRRLENGEYK